MLEGGLLPTLDSLINEGVMGDLATVEPTVPDLAWRAAITGRRLSEQNTKAVWEVFEPALHPGRLAEAPPETRVDPVELSAAELLPFVPRAAVIDQSKDRRLAALAVMLAECTSVHATATWLMENRAWTLCAIRYPAIAAFSRVFMAYHPPRMAHIPERDFEIYRQVVTGIYRFHDMMLQRLLELAGPEAAVMLISPFGYHSGTTRPALRDEELWRRNTGILVMRGPGVQRDERIYGATVLDVAPTLLAWQGIAAQGLDGRVLTEAFDRLPNCERVISDWASAGPPPEPYDLARSLLDAENAREAEAILEGLHRNLPEDPRYRFFLAAARFRLGELAACHELLANCDGPPADYMRGLLAAAERRAPQALEFLLRAERAAPGIPRLAAEIGKVYLDLERWEDAARAFQQEIANDERCAEAHCGLAVALLRFHRPDQAAPAALRAVGLRHDYPEAHFALGVAMLRLGWPLRAQQAFETCLALRPDHPEARRYLKSGG